MVKNTDLYDFFKPLDNPDKLTKFDFVIGGTNIPINVEKGTIICSLINSQALASAVKDYKKLIQQNDTLKIREYQKFQLDFQLDFYKVNSNGVNFIEAHHEALKIKQYLVSYEALEYLDNLNFQILPNYSNITFTSEQYLKKFTARAFFTFSILIELNIFEDVKIIQDFDIINYIIGGK